MQNRKRVYQKAGKFAGLFFALLCLFSCIPSAAETSGTYKIWSIPDSVSLCQQEKTTAILADGVQLTACEGTLCAACREKRTDTVFLLLQRGAGLYLDAYQCETQQIYHGSEALEPAGQSAVLEGGTSKFGCTLYIRYQLAGSGTVQYQVTLQNGTLFCNILDQYPITLWNSDAAVPQDVSSSLSEPPMSSELNSGSNMPNSEEDYGNSNSSSNTQDSTPTSSSESSQPEESESSTTPEPSSKDSQSDVLSSASENSQQQGANSLYRCNGPETVAELEQDFRNRNLVQLSGELTVRTASGVVRSTGSLITGDTVQILHNGCKQTITIVIPGDLYGSGHPDQASYERLRRCVAGGDSLTGLQAQAADMTQPVGRESLNTTPVLDTADLLLLKRAANL